MGTKIYYIAYIQRSLLININYTCLCFFCLILSCFFILELNCRPARELQFLFSISVHSHGRVSTVCRIYAFVWRRADTDRQTEKSLGPARNRTTMSTLYCHGIGMVCVRCKTRSAEFVGAISIQVCQPARPH